MAKSLAHNPILLMMTPTTSIESDNLPSDIKKAPTSETDKHAIIKVIEAVAIILSGYIFDDQLNIKVPSNPVIAVAPRTNPIELKEIPRHIKYEVMMSPVVITLRYNSDAPTPPMAMSC
mmetsp:Transcript_29017/g.61772  ORF Transcript_29017/g.61772 Transcript_29017/m.61772 type:complete len:119 (-) Transcript_29017:281-637(-)